MNNFSRRGFFDRLISTDSSARKEVNSNLDEYTSPLSRQQVAHLLRRATFGVSPAFIDKYTGKTAAEVVNVLFQNAENLKNPTPPAFINDRFPNPESLSGSAKTAASDLLNKHLRDYNVELSRWWYNLMEKDTQSILEKLVLFWHGHFATQYSICNNIPAISMYLQNDIFRKNYAGNFRTLLEKITLDGAMLRYLNGGENISEAPNENYARELQELFTIGVGNYTEQDIKEAAKILTGWRIKIFTNETSTPYYAELIPQNFDQNSKVFMGEVFTVNYEVNQNNVFENSVKKLLNVILIKKGKEASSFMATKFYKYFVYSNPAKTDSAVIAKMADLIYNNNFDLLNMFKTLLKSQHFFDDLNIGVQIKSPAEIIAGFTRHFSYDQTDSMNLMGGLGQQLLNPPNVAGWKGYRTWVSTKTLPVAIENLYTILIQSSDDKLSQWIKQFSNYNDAGNLTQAIIEVFISRTVSADRLLAYKNILLANAPDYEWATILTNSQNTGLRVRGLLKEIIKAPDFYLF